MKIDENQRIMGVRWNVNFWLLHISRERVEHMTYLTQENAMFSFTSTRCSLKLICSIVESK
jgi:hypothetical protein